VRRPRSRRLGWIAGAAVLVLGGALVAVDRLAESEVQWIVVEHDDLVLGVEVEGTLEAVESTSIGPPQVREVWEYKIAFLAEEGTEVEPGQKLVAFDTSELRQRVEQQQAERDAAHEQVEKAEREQTVQLRQAELALSEAQAELRRARLKAESPVELTAGRELRQIRLDLELAERRVAYRTSALEASRRTAAANLGALRAQATQAEKRVEETEHAIAEMERTAPIGGTVIHVANWRDEKKKVGDTCWRGDHVIELPNLERMRAAGKVHEAEAGRVVEGQRVTLELDAHPDVEFSGRVARIWRTVERENWRSPLKVVRLDIDLDETDPRRMKPGMRFRGTIETEKVERAVVVDADAVRLEPDGPVAYRKTWLGHERVRVELGRRSGGRVEVLGGLAPGDRISASDPERGPEA
jgi:HlyD family secretion protein